MPADGTPKRPKSPAPAPAPAPGARPPQAKPAGGASAGKPPAKPVPRPAPAPPPPARPAKPRAEDTLYPELRKHAWFRKLLVYPVINELEMKLQGDWLFESKAFLRMCGKRAFRETCLADPAFRKIFLSDEFKAFLERFGRGRILDFLVRSLGWLLSVALLGGCLYLALYVPVLEKVPALEGVFAKAKVALDEQKPTVNPLALTVTLVLVGVIGGTMAGACWDWAMRRRWGPCSSCGAFNFGRKFPPRFCSGCGAWVEWMN
ncbi:MAG: hypothetical protein HZA54_11745 [Planctomycetes bacterium]|nr:hypothetical protein [Planctomycetota bacterium]